MLQRGTTKLPLKNVVLDCKLLEKIHRFQYVLSSVYSEDFKGNTTWIGDGPDYCKNTKLIMEKAKIELTQIIENVVIVDGENNKELIYPQNQSHWKFSEERFYGCCHTFFMPESAEWKPVQMLEFVMKDSVDFMAHSPGSFLTTAKKYTYFYDITDLSDQRYKIDYDVYEMLDYNDQYCEKEPHYDRDECNEAALFKESIEKVGCTWPFMKNKTYICTDKDAAKKAQEIAKNGWKLPMCPSPCKYLKVLDIPGRQGSESKTKIRFYFPESIKIHKAYYVYDELSLLAEIGGYVGLFLGWSIYQITNLLDLSLDTLKTKLQYHLRLK